MAPPLFTAVAWVRLGAEHIRTAPGLPDAKVLFLLTSEADPRCYLYYCDEDGDSITDDLLADIEHAMIVAQDQYGVLPTDWDWSPWTGKKEAPWSMLLWTGEEGAIDSEETSRRRRNRRPRS